MSRILQAYRDRGAEIREAVKGERHEAVALLRAELRRMSGFGFYSGNTHRKGEVMACDSLTATLLGVDPVLPTEERDETF